MSFEELLKEIESLSHSQGYYGRLLEQINEMTPEQKELLKNSWDKVFDNILDFIMWLES